MRNCAITHPLHLELETATPIPLGYFNIVRLCVFIPSAEEHHDCRSFLAEIHAISWPIIDSKLLYVTSYAMAIAEVPQTNSSTSNH
jgi:hypothetical protein